MSSKEAYYFSHDSNARNDERILAVRMRYKASGYGVYFMILERLRDSKDYMSVKDYNIIAFDLREDASLIKSVVEDFGLFVFTDCGKYFYSESLNKRMSKKDVVKTQLSINGIKGNLIKNGYLTRENALLISDEDVIKMNENVKATALRPPPDRPPTALKEKKRKEIKEKERERVKEKTNVFLPPTQNEVYLFFLEKKLPDEVSKKESEKFYNFYEAKNWLIGKNKMQKWKASASGWISRMNDFSNNQSMTYGTKKSNGTNFTTNR